MARVSSSSFSLPSPVHRIDLHVDAHFDAFWRALATAEWDTDDVCLRARGGGWRCDWDALL